MGRFMRSEVPAGLSASIFQTVFPSGRRVAPPISSSLAPRAGEDCSGGYGYVPGARASPSSRSGMPGVTEFRLKKVKYIYIEEDSESGSKVS